MSFQTFLVIFSVVCVCFYLGTYCAAKFKQRKDQSSDPASAPEVPGNE